MTKETMMYQTVQTSATGLGDEEITEFTTLEAAKAHAKYIWGNLTTHEQKMNLVYVRKLNTIKTNGAIIESNYDIKLTYEYLF